MNAQIIFGTNGRHAPIRCALASTLLSGSLLTAAPAIAQTTPTPAGADSGASDNQLLEIVVTAQRRSENLQDTPISVTAVNSEQLATRGITNVQELARIDPSLTIPAAAGVYLPYLRGIGNDAAGTVGNEASVATYIDDVYYSRLSTAYLGLGSIQDVEILKGPQGTLFGRNSSGGAIQMFTKDPGREPDMNATIGYANYDTISGQGYASVPLTDNLAWNISAGGSDQYDGWGTGLATGLPAYRMEQFTARSKLLWDASSGTRIKLVGFYAYSKGDIGFPQDRHSGTYGSTANWSAIGLPFPPGYPNPAVRIPSSADVPGDHFYDNDLSFADYQEEKGYGGSLRVDQDLGFADFVSISAFRNSRGIGHYDADYSPQNFFYGDLRDIDRQITQELQIKSLSASTIKWIVGAFYFHSKAGYDPVVAQGDLLSVLIAPGATQNLYGLQHVNSYSVYGQMTAPIAANTNVTFGARYTIDDVSGAGETTATIPNVGEVPLSAVSSNSVTFRKPTWKGSLDHHFGDDLMAYGSVSRGYKGGTFNTFPFSPNPAKPETVDAYELGLKSELFDRRLRLNGAVFWNEITNPQVLTSTQLGIGVDLSNAQKARVRGAEIGAEAIVADGLTLRGAATYLDAIYLKYLNAPFYALNGETLTGPIPSDASGNELPHAPKLRFNLGANYAKQTLTGKWVGDINADYSGRFAWTPDNQIFEKAVTLLNASIAFTPARAERTTFSIWGKNLGGVHYYTLTQEATGPAGDIGGDIASAAAPRTFGGSISIKY